MLRKMIATFTTIVAALAVVGVAWAGGDDAGSTTSSTTVDATGSSIGGSSTSVTVGSTVPDDQSTSTSVDSSTSTSAIAVPATTADDDDDVTTTSVPLNTTTSLDDSVRVVVRDTQSIHRVPGVGTVTIAVRSGRLNLVDVSAPGWDVETKKLESDRIELEFTSGDSEGEFEARINGGRVEVEIEVDSD